jgi:hypothetical protein
MATPMTPASADVAMRGSIAVNTGANMAPLLKP